MNFVDSVYMIFIALVMCVTYFILLDLFPRFFARKITLPRKSPFFSLICIILFSALAFGASLLIQDIELANRVLHAFGGGFLGFLACFLAARDSRVDINKFQLFVFSVLIVLALGTANELLELILQNCFGFVSAPSTDDTWLDLASNTIGIMLASLCLVPFHKRTGLDPVTQNGIAS